jgi:hypothetical protein
LADPQLSRVPEQALVLSQKSADFLTYILEWYLRDYYE